MEEASSPPPDKNGKNVPKGKDAPKDAKAGAKEAPTDTKKELPKVTR